MKTFSEDTTLVLGIGNILLGDEGIGVHVIDELRGQDFGENVDLLDGGTGSFTLLGPMQSATKIILIDATLDGDSPGDVRRLTPRYSSDYPRTLTAHDIGLKDLLDAFYLSGKNIPEVTLFAVTIPEFHELTTELSDDLKPVAARVAAMVRTELAADAKTREASAAV
jgi:hydrogenase maturation protease